MAQQSSIEWLVENAEDFFGHLLAPSIILQAKKMHKEETLRLVRTMPKKTGVTQEGQKMDDEREDIANEHTSILHNWQGEKSHFIRLAFKIGHQCARQGSYNAITEQEDFDKWKELGYPMNFQQY